MKAMAPFQPDHPVTTEQQPQQSRGEGREGYVVGVDIGGTNLRLALSDRTGAIIGKRSISIVGVRDPHLIVHLIRDGVDALLQQRSSTRADLLAIAAGAPGVTDTEKGIVIATSYLMGWRNVPLRDLLEATLGVPAFVDNDANMAALGEGYAGAAQGIRNFVFLAIGTGVGAGIVLNGELFRGEGWTAGEIGYMLVPGTSVAPVERGKPGALEEIVGGEGVQSRWQSLWSENSSTLQRDATATQIFDYALQGNSHAQAVLELSSQTLAYGIYNIALVLNCPLFVLGGSIGLHPALGDRTRIVLKDRSARVQPRVITSALGTEAQLMGAIFRALETAKAQSRS
jgi:glucokinase